MNRLERTRARVAARVLRTARAAAVELGRRDPSVEAVFLYGSFASGEFDGLSDVDLLVVGGGGDLDRDRLAALRRPVEVVTMTSAEWHRRRVKPGDLAESVAREGVALYRRPAASQSKDLGARLKAARLARGLSQAAMARRAGCPQSLVSRLESGGGVRLAAVAAVARALGFELRLSPWSRA
ncbi:MAG: helix-turn-helix domain-containing protein [Alphaproteobacteria bacterium]|nr:helix-turn-helix domain-containing protein [Alphaproteobacteria bacterium]